MTAGPSDRAIRSSTASIKHCPLFLFAGAAPVR